MNFKINQDSSRNFDLDINRNVYEQSPPVKPLRRMQLSQREQETLQYMAAGYTSDEIAQSLFISKVTVDTHRKNIIKKLGVTNVTAAVAYAIRNNLIS